MAPSYCTLTTILAFASTALAACQLRNKFDGSTPQVLSQLCLGQGAGSYTFSMDVSELDVPTFSSGAPWAGIVQGQAFMIYDEGCNLKGVYSPHQDNDCGIPYVIEENFLKYVLTVTSVDFDTADPYFSFDYANGKYSIRNNHCGCSGIGSGLAVEMGCKCAFPINGEPTKREILSVPFQA